MSQASAYGSWSLAAAALAVLLAQEFHPSMLAALWAGQTAGWLAILVAGWIALLLYWPVAARLQALPGATLITLARTAAGTTGAVITALVVLALLVFHCGLIMHETAAMAVSSLYPHTPESFGVVSLTLCTLIGAYSGTAGLVRLNRTFLPILVLGLVLVLMGSLGWGNLRLLLPFWGPGPAPLLVGSVGLAAFYTPTTLFLLLGAGQVRDRRRLVRAGAAALLAASLLLAVTKVVLLQNFPLPLGFTIPYPLHEMARHVMGGRFFERIEGIWLYVWVIATACHLSALVQVAAAAYAEAFGMPTPRPAVLPLVILAQTISLYPSDQRLAINWDLAALPVVLVLGAGIPLVLSLLAARSGRRASRGA